MFTFQFLNDKIYSYTLRSHFLSFPQKNLSPKHQVTSFFEGMRENVLLIFRACGSVEQTLKPITAQIRTLGKNFVARECNGRKQNVLGFRILYVGVITLQYTNARTMWPNIGIARTSKVEFVVLLLFDLRNCF